MGKNTAEFMIYSVSQLSFFYILIIHFFFNFPGLVFTFQFPSFHSLPLFKLTFKSPRISKFEVKKNWLDFSCMNGLGSQRPEWEMMRTLIFWDSSGTSDADLFTWVISQTPTYSLKHQAKNKPEVALFTIAQTWKQSKCPSASSGRQTH